MPTARTRRTHFVPTTAIQGYSKVEDLCLIASAPRSVQAPRPRPAVPANLRTEAEIAAWARDLLTEEARRNVSEANRDNWNIILNNGNCITFAKAKNLAKQLHDIGLNIFFKLEKENTSLDRKPYVEACIIAPHNKDADWRTVPVIFSRIFDNSIEYTDMTLSNGTKGLRIDFVD